MKRKITFRDVVNVFRIILAVTFIFSGFMKTIDPWGTAVMITEYMKVFHLDIFSSWSVGLAIWVCAGELMMGFMLLFKVRVRLISIFSILAMTGFLILTFIVAVWNPLDYCGCFGDALKVDNWVSFLKNLLLWPMSFCVWYYHRGQKVFAFSRREATLTIIFALTFSTLGIYSWRHLPLVDMYPYKVGVDLRTDVLCTRCIDRDMRFIYRDKETGEEVPFELSDTTWYDDTRWEFVRTATSYDENPPEIMDYDFAMWREGLNEADQVIFADGTTHIITVRDLDYRKPNGCEKRLLPYLDKLHGEGANVIFAAGVLLNDNEEAPATVEFGGRDYTCYSMERELVKLLMRAEIGEVVLEEGVIVSKRSCWDLK